MRRLISLVVLLLTFAGMSGVAVAGDSAPEPVAAEIKALLERFFEARGNEDMASALACIRTDPKTREAFREFLQLGFDNASNQRFTLSRFSARPPINGVPIVRVLVRFSWLPTGRKEPELGRQHWDVALIRESDGWKLGGHRVVELHLFSEFKSTRKAAERAELLRMEADVIDSWLTFELRREADESTEKGNPNQATLDEAERLVNIGFEVSEWMNSDHERAYNHLMRGLIRERARKWNPALEDWNKAIEHFEKANNKQGLAKAYRNAGRVYHQRGSFKQAVKAYELAIGYWKEEGDASSEAGCIQSLGVVHLDAGRASDALNAFEQALPIYQRLGDRKSEAQIIGNIATVRHEQERYAEALELYEKAMRIDVEIGNHEAESIHLTNLANLYDVLGQLEEAERRYRRAVKAAEEVGNRTNVMVALLNLSDFLTRNGDPTGAFEAGKASMQISIEIGDARFRAQSLNTLGELLFRDREWETAITFYLDALEVSRSTGNRIQEGIAVLGLASAHARIGKVGHALVYFEQSHSLADSTGNLMLKMDTARHHADMHRERGDIPSAAKHYRKAIEVVEQIRTQTVVRSMQTSYLRKYSFLYERLAECYVRLGDARKAFAVSEQLRGRTLVDVIRSGSFRITKAMTLGERANEAALESRLAAVTRDLAKAVLSDDVDRLKTAQAEARRDLQKLQDLLYARHPQLRAQRADFAPATPDQLAVRLFTLAPKSALLSYFTLDDQTLLFVLRPGAAGNARLTMHRIPVGRIPLVRRAEELWQACSTPGGAYEPPAKSLYRDLIQPAMPDLVGVNHLILVPSSDLGILPFSALLNEKSVPLIGNYSVSYAPSATALMHQADLSPTRSATSNGLPLLAFGNPIFPPNLGELPATEGEVAEISRLFGPRARSFIRKEALEARAKELLTRARVVHFATHGTLDERAPMYSSVVLTKDAREDGFLQARELAEMELNAEMVVLSACETALGQKVRGEGVVGLAWALFVGGAESAVTSQWQVPDDSTRSLMIQFYRRLLRPGANRAQAMREAQLSLFRDKRYAHPYHWAPFTLSGQWLPGKSYTSAKARTGNVPAPRTFTGAAVNRNP